MIRLVNDWVYGGALAAGMLCIVAVGLAGLIGTPLLAVFLLIPAYMFHQLEEHADERFRLFLDQELGKGSPVLTRLDIFIVNVPGVWGVFALAFTLAATVHIGFGLIPAYAALLNAFAHAAQAVKMQKYNPGLMTGVLLFVPLSAWTIASVNSASAGDVPFHVLGLFIAALSHAAILAVASRRLNASRV